MLKKSPIRSCAVNLDEDDKLIIYVWSIGYESPVVGNGNLQDKNGREVKVAVCCYLSALHG
jgi:hypothetical protein